MKMAWKPDIKIISLGEEVFPKKFLREAYKFAWENSEDIATQTGAVLVDPDLEEILAYGTNHFPKGLNPTKEQKLDRNYKLKHIIHAEPAVINVAAKIGKSTEDSYMFMPWVPCTPCALAIIDSGIKELIGHKQMIMKTPERWWESTEYALDLLRKAEIKLSMYDGKIGGGIKNLFNGSEWEP